MDTKYLEILKAPVVTEKSANMAQNEGKYAFKVDPTIAMQSVPVMQLIRATFLVFLNL